MKLNRLIKTTVCALLMLSVSFMLAGALIPAQNANAAEAPAKKTITVAGSSTVYAEPDMATISLGVETRNAVASQAQSDNAAKMQAVINAITAAGVDKKDITTSGYNIYSDYSYGTDGRSVPSGYVVNNTLTITLRDIKKLGAIIDTAGKSGSNSMGGISFATSKYDSLYNQALRQAVSQAKSKGDIIASAVGASIGNPSAIVEGSAGYYSPMVSSRAMADTANSTPIETGQLSITASITATYEY